MQYAPSAHWDRVFRTLRHAGTDLDWENQWTGAFTLLLHTHQVQHLLDLGCGTGNDVVRLAQHGYSVVGLDYSREAIHQAATKTPARAALLVADMAAPLPFVDACFDAVISNVAMHMFDDVRTRALFAEVQRIVQPGGMFLFHVNALEDRPLRAKRKPPVQELEPNYILEADGQTMHFFSAPYLRELLTGWSHVHLEFVEITEQRTGEPFKCVWRGVASCKSCTTSLCAESQGVKTEASTRPVLVTETAPNKACSQTADRRWRPPAIGSLRPCHGNLYL